MVKMKLIQPISSWLIQELKTIWFWLSVVLGTAFTFVIYQEVLVKLWAFESLRVNLYSIFLFVILSAFCYCILTYFLLPQLKKFTKIKRAVILGLSIVSSLILVIILVNQPTFSKETVYFLLPTHTIQIEARAADITGNEDIVLSLFSNQAQGELSFNALDVKGWERRGNQLFLSNPAGNQITWRGKVGYDASILFTSRSSPAMINVAWDGTNTQKSLYSAFPHDISITNQFKVPFYAGWPLVALSIFLSITFFGLILLVGLLLFPYVAPLLIVWFSFLLAYWPGTLNSDAMIQWLQTISGDYVDWQPVFHTLTMEFLNHIWYSPAAVAITQILGLSVVVGYSLHSFKQHNAPKWVPWVVVGLLVFTPVNGFLVISLYKDIPFSIFILLLSVLILKIITSKGGWLKSKWNLVLLGLTFILVTLYRQNGVTVPLGSVVLVGLFFPRYWKQLLGCTIVFLLVYFVVKGPIYDQLGVQKRDMQRGEKVMLNIVASQIHEGTYLSPSEQNLVQRLFHIDGYNYDCYRNTQLFTNINKSVEITNYVEENSKAIYLLAFDLTVRSPMPTLKYFDCVSSFVLKVVQPKKSYYSFGSRDIFTNDIGLVTNSRLPGLKKFLDEWDTFAQKPQFSWFFFRSGFWLYLSVATCLLYCYLKKSWLYFLVLIPSLAAVLPMALISVSQYVRYAYPVNLCGTIFSVYFLGMSLQNLWHSYRGRVTKNLSEN